MRVNFVNPSTNQEVYGLLVNLWSMGAPYNQVKELMTEQGYYVPEDQWNTFVKLLDTQTDLDIGMRQHEQQNINNLGGNY